MENPYNVVPYQSTPFPQAHINRLATMASLYGMRTPDLDNCRVLEVGCGEGAHLIPMAMEFPDSQFVGIDTAERPIARAVDAAAELGIENITFRVADVCNLAGKPGECDYLIAHGLYSWVSPETQDRILELCGRVLAATGVAYVSYNAYPAWHVRDMTRNMVRMHTAGVDDPVEIRNRAIALLAAIYRSQGPTDPYREAIRSEMERIMAKDPALCFHDDFGEYNYPIYFSEFIRRAGEHELQFLSEAESSDLAHGVELGDESREALEAVQGVIEREQYYDFLACRGFRRTLLCRAEQTLDRSLPVERLKTFHYAAALDYAPEMVTSLHSNAPMEFTSQSSFSVTVNQPFVKAALLELANAWPATRSFDQLIAAASSAIETTPEEAEKMLRELLLRIHMPGVLEMSVLPWKYTSVVSERPVASRLARLQAGRGNRVTSLRHRPVEFEAPLPRLVLPLLDGSRDLDALSRDLSVARNDVEEALQELHELGLLEA